MNLVSIDLVKGQMRAYTSIAGNRPKLVQTVDIQGYEQRVMEGGFSFDEAQIEQFRQDPTGFMQRNAPEGGHAA